VCLLCQDVLPSSFKFLVHTGNDTGTGLEAVMYVNATSQEQAQYWLTQYQHLSQLFRTARTWPDTGLKLLFKVRYDILSLLLVILFVGSLYYLCNIFQYLFDICLCCRIVQVWRLVILLKSGPIELRPNV